MHGPQARPDHRFDALRQATAQRLTALERQQAEAALAASAIAATPRNFLSGVVAAFLIALGAAVLGGNSPTPWVPWLWCASTSTFLLRGAWIAYRFGRSSPHAGDALQVVRQLTRNAAFCGLAWGASAWVVLPAANPHADAFVATGIAMILAGGAGAQAASRPWVLTFVGVTTGVFVLGLLRQAHAFQALLAAGFVLLAFVIASFARTQEMALRDAVYFGIESERLLAQRTAQEQATEQARREAERARAVAEMADQAKTRFLAAAGHDLRQPMHALVQYYAHLKRDNGDPALGPTLLRMGQSITAMQDLLENLLEVSRLMAGAVKPTLRPLNIGELLDRLDAQLRPIAQDKGLSFEIDVHRHGQVHGDPVLLMRLIFNLTHNALKYTRRGRVMVRARQRSEAVTVLVADSGIGIPQTEQHKVFEAFYQLDNVARSDRGRGLGLGLAIVKQLVDLMAVPMRMRSKPGRGTVFRLRLPMPPPATAPPAGALPPGPSRSSLTLGATIVLIDDHEDALQATADTLAGLGCQVIAARSTAEAIQQLSRIDLVPELVLSDYRLADGNGLTAIDQVTGHLSLRFGSEIRTGRLILSGDTAPALLDAVHRSGVEMLHKPVAPEVLHQALVRQLSRL